MHDDVRAELRAIRRDVEQARRLARDASTRAYSLRATDPLREYFDLISRRLVSIAGHVQTAETTTDQE